MRPKPVTTTPKPEQRSDAWLGATRSLSRMLADLSPVAMVTLSLLLAVPATSRSLAQADGKNTQDAITEVAKDTPGPNWALVWHDEFCCAGPGEALESGSRSEGGIDKSVWTIDVGNGPNHDGWGNQEVQWYTERSLNTHITTDVAKERCVLALHAEAEPIEGYEYSSGRLNTAQHPVAGNIMPPYNETTETFLDGGKVRVEARMQLPVGTTSGTWPAFWMLPTEPDRDWPQSGEIDIMEAFRNQMAPVSTLHFGGPGLENRVMLPRNHTCDHDCPDGYHVWAMEWEVNTVGRTQVATMTFFLDNDTQASFNSSQWWSRDENEEERDQGPLAPFNQPFHKILNLAVGDEHCDIACVPNATEAEVYDQTFIVDWVRVWQFPASAVDPLPLNVSDRTCTYEKENSAAVLSLRAALPIAAALACLLAVLI